MKLQIVENIQRSDEVKSIVLSSEVLNMEEAIISVLSPIIDDGTWFKLDEVSAKSRRMDELTLQKSKETTRREKMVLLTDGRNTIYLLDFTEKSEKVRHDPVFKVVGADALAIGRTLMNGIFKLLTKKLIKMDDKVVKDLSSLLGDKGNVEKIVHQVQEEAEMIIAEKLRVEMI